MSYVKDPPKLYINSTYIRYVKSTKVLGLIIDEDLNLSEHAVQKLKECSKKWGLITKSTNRNHGLNIRSLLQLLKTTILTKLGYAAPIWLPNNIHIFKEFWNAVIMKISGAMLNPNRDLIELALHLPPLEIQLEILTVKFLCKAISGSDSITSVLVQTEGSLYAQFHKQISAIKKFLIWKGTTSSSRLRKHHINLLSLESQTSAHYSKTEMMEYQQKYGWKVF